MEITGHGRTYDKGTKVSVWSQMIECLQKLGLCTGEPLKIFTLSSLLFFFLENIWRVIYCEEGYTRRNVISLRTYFHRTKFIFIEQRQKFMIIWGFGGIFRAKRKIMVFCCLFVFSVWLYQIFCSLLKVISSEPLGQIVIIAWICFCNTKLSICLKLLSNVMI